MYKSSYTFCHTDQDWGTVSLWAFGQVQPDSEVSLILIENGAYYLACVILKFVK